MNFNYRNRFYNLGYNVFGVMQLTGESGVGKSLFSQDLNSVRGYSPDLQEEVLIIDMNTAVNLDNLSENMKKYKTIVIDNADILLKEKRHQDLIWQSVQKSENYWIIVGRNTFGCVPFSCVGVLTSRKDDDKYYFTVDYSKAG